MPSALQEAENVVTNDRQRDYGHPYDDFNRAMGMLNALGYRFMQPDGTCRELQATDHPIIMTCVKLSREVHHHKWDNIVDIHGYMKCLEMVINRGEELRAAATRKEAENAVVKDGPPADGTVYPAHHDDDAAARMLERTGIPFDEWNKFKLRHPTGQYLLEQFAKEKGLSFHQYWAALNMAK